MIARRRIREAPPSAPLWVLTFSDMMSLLVAFFVLIVSFSTLNKQGFGQVMNSVQSALGGMPQFYATPEAAALANERRTAAAVRLQRALQIEGVDKQATVEYEGADGMRIVLLEPVLFEAGSAALRPDANRVLTALGEALAAMPEAQVDVQGHTDTTPPAGTYRDNYDLGYYRARAVAERAAASAGAGMQQYAVSACGPNRPAATNESEEGRRANRRVEIHVRGIGAGLGKSPPPDATPGRGKEG